MSEKVRIVVTPAKGGVFFPAWRSVYVRKSLDEICSYIEMELDPAERERIAPHDQVQVRYTNDYMAALADALQAERPVATGYVDDVNFSVAGSSKTLSVTARSAARDIIDSSWSGSYTDKSLLNLVSEIGKTFKIDVCHQPTDFEGAPLDGTTIVASFNFESESPWQKLVQEADNQGYIISSNQLGGLYVWQVARGRRTEPFEVSEEEGIIALTDKSSGAAQFRTYTYNGDTISKTDTDNRCPTRRALTVNLSKEIDASNLERRIKTEMLRRRGRTLTVTMKRWGLSEEKLARMGSLTAKEVLWELNFYVPVRVPSLGMKTDMLVSQVEYRADARETRCVVSLVPKENYL